MAPYIYYYYIMLPIGKGPVFPHSDTDSIEISSWHGLGKAN